MPEGVVENISRIIQKLPFHKERQETLQKTVPNSEFEIQAQIQKTHFDCGQTCLDMLGYEGHQMFPEKEVKSSDLRSIPGAQDVTVLVGQEETLDYRYPHIWILLGKDKVAGATHWVIRYKDKIYCPTIGEMNAKEYKDKYVAFILQEFVVPFKGQQVPEQYYRQHISREETSHQPSRKVSVPEAVPEERSKTVEPKVGKTYMLFRRKIKYLGERKLNNGIKQFQVEYLDDPTENSSSEEKRGQTSWEGEWQLYRLQHFDKEN